jgi:beta-lactamase class A
VAAVVTAVLALTAGVLLAGKPHAGPARAARAVGSGVAGRRVPGSPGPAPGTPAAGSRPPTGQPAPARHQDPFGPAATELATSRPGRIQAAVLDVRTGQVWDLGHGRAQAEASIVKVDILETLLSRHRGSGPGLPAADLPLAQEMIEDSDNDAATALWYAAGGPDRIQAYNAAARLRHTTMSRCVDCPGFPWPGWGLTTTTPNDQITLLRQLVMPSPLLTLGQRGYLLRLMEQVTAAQRWGVSGGVPPGVTVALKNGWLPLDSTDDNWQVNSIGWIRGRGRDYLIAVLTTGNATEQQGIGIIDELAGIVWRNMR